MRMNIVRLAAVCLGIMAVACGGATTTHTANEPPPSTFAEQVKWGQTLYADKCASCHGDSGQGGSAPRVVGLTEGALPLEPPAGATVRKERFVTVADVGTFVAERMPPGRGGSLTSEEAFAILAFDLHANGIDLETKLDAAGAKALTIPR